jgi:iron complex transport system permease protein
LSTTTTSPKAAARPGRDRRAQVRGIVRSRSLLALGLGAAVVVLVVVALASLGVGSRPIPLGTVVEALTDWDPADRDHLIVRDLRGPRTLIGLLVGAALGLSGVLLQGLTRNPLADPGILGISAGAALAAAAAVLFLGLGSVYGYVWFAFGGAALGGALVYAIGSRGRDRSSPINLALAGAAVTAIMTSLTTLILLLDLATLDVLRFWLVGSLSGRSLDVAGQVWPFIVAGSATALLLGRLLNALSLGDDVARSLGIRLAGARSLVGISAIVLAGAATAAAGPIVFVGLTIPHLVRAITGPDYRWILPYSAVLAPVLLLGSDIVGRIVARPAELQVGIVTALIGGPFFVALVRRRKLAEL